MNQVPPSPWGRFKFFQKFAEIFTAQGWPPVHWWQMKKSSIRKMLIILLGHFWIYIYEFLPYFTLRYLQPDIVPIVCHRCRWYWRQFATGVVDIGSKFAATDFVATSAKLATSINNTSETGGKICRWCCWYRWQFAAGVIDTGGTPSLVNISANIQKNLKRS